MPCQLCHHIMPTGKNCGAPALRTKRFCHFHIRLARRSNYHYTVPTHSALPTDQPIRVPRIKDLSSVQKALCDVFQALAAGRVEPRRASALIRLLEVGSRSLPR